VSRDDVIVDNSSSPIVDVQYSNIGMTSRKEIRAIVVGLFDHTLIHLKLLRRRDKVFFSKYVTILVVVGIDRVDFVFAFGLIYYFVWPLTTPSSVRCRRRDG